jgi:hypothetical protein
VFFIYLLGFEFFFPEGPMEKKLYYPKLGSTFTHLQKKFQKITMKIDIVDSCLNFQLSLWGTIVL